MFHDPLTVTAIRNTLIFVVEAVALQFFIGLGLALFFSTLPLGIKGEAMFRTFLCIPMMVTPVLVGLIWRYMLNPLYGVVNFPLVAIGLPSLPWYTASSTALFSLVIIDTWMMTPFMFLLLSSGLKMISRDFYEAAQLDGASKWQRFMFITMPLLKPVIFVAIAIRTIDAFRLFDEVFVLTKGGPGSSTEVISIHIWRVGFKFFHVGYAAAMSYVILAIILAITVFLYKTMGAE